MKNAIFSSIQIIRYSMKIDHLILIVLFCLAGASLLGFEDSFAEESPQVEDGTDSALAEQDHEDQHKLTKEEQKEMKVGSESLKPRQEAENKGDSSAAANENTDKKPLDLTFKPDFPDNPKWNDQFNTEREQRYQDLFGDANKNRKLLLKGEFLRSFEIEEEKYKAIDGAGIRLELNTE